MSLGFRKRRDGAAEHVPKTGIKVSQADGDPFPRHRLGRFKWGLVEGERRDGESWRPIAKRKAEVSEATAV